MSWGNGRRGSPDPALVTYQWKQHRVYWKRQRLPCARCGGWIDYDGPRGRARAQKRLPVEVRQQLLDGIYSGQPFRRVLRDLGLTSNQVWGSPGGRAPTRAELNGARRAAHSLAALGRAQVLHVPGADADADSGDRDYLVLAKPNVIMNDIRLRGLAVAGTAAAGRKSPDNHAQAARNLKRLFAIEHDSGSSAVGAVS
jgi:hypothetical protein